MALARASTSMAMNGATWLRAAILSGRGNELVAIGLLMSISVARFCHNPAATARRPRLKRAGCERWGTPEQGGKGQVDVRHAFRSGLALALGAMLGLLPYGSARAATISLIRDAEIEATLDEIAGPILEAAGLGRDSVSIYIVRTLSSTRSSRAA